MEFWRTCVVDGTRYEYCSHCDRFNKLETWRYIFCSENCMGIDDVYYKYKGNKISADEAVKKLENCKLPPTDKIHKVMSPVIIDMYANSCKDECGY